MRKRNKSVRIHREYLGEKNGKIFRREDCYSRNEKKRTKFQCEVSFFEGEEEMGK